MDISAMSTFISQSNLKQAVSLSVTKMALDNTQIKGQMIKDLADVNLKMMEQSVNPHLGSNIDTRV